MSERQLARAANLSHSTVNHLVTGRRTGCSPATARAIETALGCQEGTLFFAGHADSGFPILSDPQ